MTVQQMTAAARQAARTLASSGVKERNRALIAMAESLEAASPNILSENRKDVEAGRQNGMSDALQDRLALTESRICAMAEGLRQIAALPDPVGQVISGGKQPSGLDIVKVRVPLGVIASIYESRPNVTADVAGLCIKSGNAAILRGGSEAIHSNRAIAAALIEACSSSGLPAESIQLIPVTDRAAALELLQAERDVDVVIPRGGEGLKKFVLENSKIPVLTALGGNCHTFIDESADLGMASKIAFNAKVSRPSVCNSMESLLIHRSVVSSLLPDLAQKYTDAGVELRVCSESLEFIETASLASEEDYATEFLAPILAIKIVESLDEALDHIDRYGTRHSEAIVTQNYANAERFTQEVDAACVYINASTRFTDGGEFGQGAEVGISTQKLHARGPIGISELTTYKYIIRGNGQVR